MRFKVIHWFYYRFYKRLKKSLIRIVTNFLISPTDLVLTSENYNYPNQSQLQIVINAIDNAINLDFSRESLFIPRAKDRAWFCQFPGEHYRLLAGLCQTVKPKLSIEIGTSRGLGSLALSLFSKKVVSFDIVPLSSVPESVSQLELGETFEQIIADLSLLDNYLKYQDVIYKADILLIDGPKNVIFENIIIPKLVISMKPGSILVIDDIRFLNMQSIWDSIMKPKIDISSFGHNSGTGIVFI